MKGIATILVFTFAFIATARAQVMLDLSQITCKQFLASDAERQALIGSWMSGYFSAQRRISTYSISVTLNEIEKSSAITARRTSPIR
jgi:HdeA/HdeB family